MPEAIKAKDVDPRATSVSDARSRRQARRAFSKMTFGELDDRQKDELLKQIAIKLKLISPDP